MTKKTTSRPQVEVLEDRTTPSAWTAFDFTGHGLWRWSDDHGYQQLGTNDNSSNLAINQNGDVAVSYGSGLNGTLWRITGNGWQQVGTAAPTSLAIASNDWIAASFIFPGSVAGGATPTLASGGVWRITPQLGWQKISDLNPTLKNLIATQVGVTNNGTVVADFGTNGLWRFTDSGGWQELTTQNATTMAVSDNGWIVGSFGSSGVWRLNDNNGWQLLTNQAVPSQLAVDNDGDVAGEFNGHGLWRIGENNNDGWKQLTSVDAAPVGIGISSDNQQVVADFAGKGVYQFNNNGDFTQIAPLEANRVASA